MKHTVYHIKVQTKLKIQQSLALMWTPAEIIGPKNIYMYFVQLCFYSVYYKQDKIGRGKWLHLKNELSWKLRVERGNDAIPLTRTTRWKILLKTAI